MNLNIRVIPNEQHRYKTVGDYWLDSDGVWQIRVSRMSNWRYEFLVAIHEVIELGLVVHAGVKQEAIDKFDMDYEDHRHPDDDSEPGDHPEAPYRLFHCLATGVERIVAAFLGVCWKTYEDEINSI
jgi:hypothetical protein